MHSLLDVSVCSVCYLVLTEDSNPCVQTQNLSTPPPPTSPHVVGETATQNGPEGRPPHTAVTINSDAEFPVKAALPPPSE